jgi:hypothetical protein
MNPPQDSDPPAARLVNEQNQPVSIAVLSEKFEVGEK